MKNSYIGIKIEEDLKYRCEVLAAKEGRSLSNFIQLLLVREVLKQGGVK